MNILSAKNLNKSYGSIQAVENLTLEIVQGEFLGFLGPNGAGKTTTIRMLTGMLPPDSGEITIAGLSSDRKTDIARSIGVVPESRGFYDWMTAEEYLIFFARLYDIADCKKTTNNLLDQVRLSDRKNSKIGTYSRGMKQRLALARALINNPKILFLDEPTLGLDPQGQEDIQKFLQNLNRQGVTILFSSHLLPEVSALCSRIVIINHGRLIASGTISELQQQVHRQESSLKDIFFLLTKNND
ncbi:MAG: ABC transporter ATP-binding protein [Candidatus Omnitrophica bacterium]|nr:ABC transporter ATP-binding protein [Candidatus Omnitrophota bacterium]